MLLDMCKSNNLLILNGRCGYDKSKGSLTFRNRSTIDYFVVSLECLQFVNNFVVTDLDPTYSDGHALISTSFVFHKPISFDKSIKKCNSTKPKWHPEKKTEFLNNLDKDKIKNLHQQLHIASANKASLSQDSLTEFCNEIANIFVHSESLTVGSDDQLPTDISYNRQKHNKWFGKECKSARNNYLKAKKIHNKIPTHENKNRLTSASKSYKKKMNFHINKFNRLQQKKLRKLHDKNPKQYWKILNSIDDKDEKSNIELDTLFNFFKDLNKSNDSAYDDQTNNNINVHIDEETDDILNCYITENEIIKGIKSLKNNKACSNDRIINEYLKNTADLMVPIYVLFFNLVLDTGFLPESWLEGIIRPIYKRKGDPHQPENYRPITILSCFGKLFTSILNSRLHKFLELNNILEENQAGFRSGYSTTDHIFVLQSLIELLKVKKMKLFCSFIDFSKAFDSVWRVGLWMKLISNNINGKIFRVIHNMYKNIKSCVSFNGVQSSFFQSFRGVRQGENLSPILFAIFLNDLESFMANNGATGLNLDLNYDQLTIFLKIFVLLYADDTVIFGTDENQFQANLDLFFEYATTWKLDINYDKTKIMIFGTRNDDRFEFKLGTHAISICKEFKYLGVIFSKNWSFHSAIKHNVEHGRKAMNLLYKRIRNLNLPIDLQIKLFDHTIAPILLYGCEIWGYQNTQIIENVHNDFLRNILKLRKSTPLYILYAELGRRPLQINIKNRMIGFWISIINGKNSKLTNLLYNTLYNENELGNYNFKWIKCIKDTLISVGKIGLFYADSLQNAQALKLSIKQTLVDLYTQDWYSKLNNSSKGKNYSIFKTDICMEKYLLHLPRKSYLSLCKFRTSNHKLPIEVGRWEGVPLNEKKCLKCNTDIGDEFHYLFKCSHFTNERTLYLKPYFYRRPNILKLRKLYSSSNRKTLINLAKFVELIMKTFE